MKITPPGHSVIPRVLPPAAETRSETSAAPKPASAPQRSAATVAPPVASFAPPLTGAMKWHVAAAAQEIAPTATGKSHMSPAQQARAAILNDPSLKDRPFGAVVSAIARGLPLPGTEAPPATPPADETAAPAEPDESSDAPADLPSDLVEVPASPDGTNGTQPAAESAPPVAETTVAAEDPPVDLQEPPIEGASDGTGEGGTPAAVTEIDPATAPDGTGDSVLLASADPVAANPLIDDLLEQLAAPATVAADTPAWDTEGTES